MPIDVRALRIARKLTQAQLGELVKVSQKRIARIEACPDVVSFVQLRRILSVLGCEITVSMKDNWRAPYSEAGPSSVYVLPHATQPLLKIGKANAAEIRAKTLGNIDIENAYQMIAENERHAFRVERILHRTFHKWRIPQQEAVRLGMLQGGATEWFKSDCLPRILHFAQGNADLLGCVIQRVK